MGSKVRQEMVRAPVSAEELFANGMKRSFGRIPDAPHGNHLNLGAGDNPVPDESLLGAIGGGDVFSTLNMDRPVWEAPALPGIVGGSIAAVHAYHFFEHLDHQTFRGMLAEIDRVLMPRGLVYACVPYARSDIAFQDTDHKLFFTEESWRTLLDNHYYDAQYGKEFNWTIQFNMIAGVAGRNLAVLTVLRKEA